jgi:hypothetical protein
MKTVRINLCLTEEASEKLDSLASPRKRGVFISNLIMDFVPQSERLQALEERVDAIEERLSNL